MLAGGRSRRLGGTPKATLSYLGLPLLVHAVTALHGAGGGVAVVGPDSLRPTLGHDGGTVLTRESPAFAGPAAAIMAGLDALPPGACWVVVVACDMPLVADVVPVLLAALGRSGGTADGVLAVDGGRDQPLAGVYRRAALAAAGERLRARGSLDNAPVRALIASLDLARVDVPPGSTADVDSWPDADRFAIRAVPASKGPAMSQEEILAEWAKSLLDGFEIPDAEIDVDAVLRLAGEAAHAILRPAAPLTTFVAGYAAGLAAGSGQGGSAAAMDSAISHAGRLVRDNTPEQTGAPDAGTA